MNFADKLLKFHEAIAFPFKPFILPWIKLNLPTIGEETQSKSTYVIRRLWSSSLNSLSLTKFERCQLSAFGRVAAYDANHYYAIY